MNPLKQAKKKIAMLIGGMRSQLLYYAKRCCAEKITGHIYTAT